MGIPTLLRHSLATGRRPYIPLFWRLFIPNAAVLTAACLVLYVEPANGQLLVLVLGLVTMLSINVVLMRRAFGPLGRLQAAMSTTDPLAPGRRIAVSGPESEVTLLGHAFNDMLDRLEDERRDSALRAQTAQEDERRRLAADLHDDVGQSLTALALELRRVADEAPPQLRENVLSSRRLTVSTLEDVRRLARDLRPEALDQLGLVAAVASLCKRFSEHSGIPVDCRLERDLPALGADADLVIYRVAQESLTNVARHARASRVRMELRRAAEGVELRVGDDGAGLEPSRRGGGIRGMRERALLVGAELAFERSAEGGAQVRMHVPADGVH